MIDDENQRAKDKLTTIIPTKESRKANSRAASLDTIKSAFIAEGLTPEQICDRFALSPERVLSLIESNNLESLRNSYRKEGLKALQKVQVDQAQTLMDMENKFKQLRIVQLESQLQDYLAYYMRHGDMKKRHPITGEVLLDTNEIPLQINLPSLAKELLQLKESLVLSEGMKKILVSIDDIIKPQNSPNSTEGDVIDVNELESLFERKHE